MSFVYGSCFHSNVFIFFIFFQCFYFYCSKLYQSFPLWVIGKALYFLSFFSVFTDAMPSQFSSFQSLSRV